MSQEFCCFVGPRIGKPRLVQASNMDLFLLFLVGINSTAPDATWSVLRETSEV